MTILYSDDLFPHEKSGGTSKEYIGKTIGEILAAHPNPKRFVKGFNARNNKYCISDEIMIDTKKSGYFHRR